MIDRKPKLKLYNGSEECKYGCGNIGKYISKNGSIMCDTSHHKCPSIKEKKKKTWIATYGSDNPMKNEKIKTTAQRTMKDRYGVKSYSMTDDWSIKCKETYQKKYGVDHLFQADDFKKQTKQKCIDNYGVDNISKSPEIIQRIKDTWNDKYGVDNIMVLDEIKEKYKNTMKERYGVEHNWCNGPLRKQTISSVSNAEVIWLDECMINDRQVLLYGKSGKRYCVDGFDSDTNTIYEYLGIFWHGHPAYFDKLEIHPLLNKTYGELYNKTLERLADLANNEYKIIAMWENGEYIHD